jgi:hypothetical protein
MVALSEKLTKFSALDIIPVPSQKQVWVLEDSGSVSIWPSSAKQVSTSTDILITTLILEDDKITSLRAVGTDVWAGGESGKIHVVSAATRKVLKVLDQHNVAPISSICAWHHTVWCADSSGNISTWS